MADATDRWTGRVIDGRYVVESVIGQGGMGVVLRAHHKFTGAQVALKMLQPDMQLNVEAQNRFLAEARTPTSIGHPGIVQVLDAGTTPEGELYLAMELLTGRTLRHAMYPTLPPQVARRVTLELLDALGAAHARGIVHRDLKPENVFLVGAASTVKLLDFGIAKVVETGRTAAGMMLGTLSYMAPEQLSDASTVDARADLWAVGVMVYEMLSGKLPYRGTQLADIMTALATQEPDPIRVYLPTATPAMDAFFGRALARDRNQRFASAQDMALGVAAMQLDGTAPGSQVISTLTGVGSPRSHVMTAADSGPQLPSRQPFTAPQPAAAPSTPFTAPQAVAAAPSVPFTAPQAVAAAPSVPFPATQAIAGPSAPSAHPFAPPPPPRGPAPVPPMQPVSPMQPGMPPGQPPRAPTNGYGFQNPTAGPPPAKKAAGFDKTSWIVMGAAAAGVLVLVLVFALKKQELSRGIDACADSCHTLAQCNSQIDETRCELRCNLEPKVAGCIQSSAGSCDTFASCMDAAAEPMPLKFAHDTDTNSGGTDWSTTSP